ncbi:MAG TPA: hypothetical protein EYG48_03820 [Methylococcales bacterium]|nr:hypothetical protein [Methylococcales bacterium]
MICSPLTTDRAALGGLSLKLPGSVETESRNSLTVKLPAARPPPASTKENYIRANTLQDERITIHHRTFGIMHEDRFTIGTSIPKLSYLTRFDEFILWSTVLIFGALLETVYTSSFTKCSKFDQARKTDSWCCWIFPSALIVVAVMPLSI